MSNDDDGNGTAPRELGKTLRRIRDLRALSQGDLGALAGTTRNYIASLETGRIEEPSVWRLHALARALGVTMEALLGQPALSVRTPAGLTLPEAEAELVRRLRLAGIAPFQEMDQAAFDAFMPEADVTMADIEAAAIVAVSTFLDYAHDLDREGIAKAFFGGGVCAHALVVANSRR